MSGITWEFQYIIDTPPWHGDGSEHVSPRKTTVKKTGQVVSTVISVATKEKVYDPEWEGRSMFQEHSVASVDIINWFRNLMSASGATAAFPPFATMPKAATFTAGTAAIAPFIFLLTGAMVMVISISCILPSGNEWFKTASKELEEAQKALQKAQEAHTEKRVADAFNALLEAKLGLANMWGALVMGVGQISVGAVAICTTPMITKALNIAAFSSTYMKDAFIAGSGCILGAVYIVRGILKGYCATANLIRVSNFYNQFKETLKTNAEETPQEGLNRAITFIENTQDVGEAYWGRRVDGSCLKGGVAAIVESSDQDKINYLAKVDKGIYSTKLKNQITLFVSAAMIVGGILSIVACCVTTGGVPLIIGLACSIAFSSMEGVFLTTDLTSIYEKVLNRLYVESRELAILKEALQKQNISSGFEANLFLEQAQ